MNSFDFGRFGNLSQVRLLDLGAGGGRHSIDALLGGAKVVAVELEIATLFELRENVMTAAKYADRDPFELLGNLTLMVCDARMLPFADVSFDVVIIAEVLEHLREDVAVIAGVERITKIGGHVGISVPRAFPELVNWALSKQYHSVEGGHIRIYRRSILFDRIQRGSLVVVSYSHMHGLHTPYWWLKCLLGLDNSNVRLVAWYHGLLVRQMMHQSRLLDLFDRVLNPMIGKSLIVYARKIS